MDELKEIVWSILWQKHEREDLVVGPALVYMAEMRCRKKGNGWKYRRGGRGEGIREDGWINQGRSVPYAGASTSLTI